MIKRTTRFTGRVIGSIKRRAESTVKATPGYLGEVASEFKQGYQHQEADKPKKS